MLFENSPVYSDLNYMVAQEAGNVIYKQIHTIDVFSRNGCSSKRNILFTITKQELNVLKIKLHDASEYLFNYSAVLDCQVFEKMKVEQLLDINFEELRLQVVELLKQTLSKKMLVRLEIADDCCKLIFYEQSRIKALVLLTIDLVLTSHKELVVEMSTNIVKLKDCNTALTSQLQRTKFQLEEKESLLRTEIVKNCDLEKQFRKNLELIQQFLFSQLRQTEQLLIEKLQKLTLRHIHLLEKCQIIKTENVLKCESNCRLVQSMQNLRLENERNCVIVEELKHEIEKTKSAMFRTEQNFYDLQQILTKKERENREIQKELNELKKDIKDATIIIAHKSKFNDEISKDLAKANQILVKFKTRIDLLSKELNEVEEKNRDKDKTIRQLNEEINKVKSDFEHYREHFNAEGFKKLDSELFLTNKKAEEVEKKFREVTKLNGLLSNKLAVSDGFDSRRPHWMPPDL